jgi:hypothetical protein
VIGIVNGAFVVAVLASFTVLVVTLSPSEGLLLATTFMSSEM